MNPNTNLVTFDGKSFFPQDFIDMNVQAKKSKALVCDESENLKGVESVNNLIEEVDDRQPA
jgi:hypothetical protein